jgi:conjugative transfer signal peptidase TraF
MVERRDLPLFAWGEALRGARRRRRMLARRGTLLGLGCACLVATIAAPPRPWLVWNASASAPTGLYAVQPGTAAARGEMVIARIPAAVRDLAARRHYIPANVPLVKRVAGVAGDRICAAGDTITINGRRVAVRLATDRLGRSLPRWNGCRTLRDGTLFLLMAETPDSFDGRYFGPTAAGDVIGPATTLWVKPVNGSNHG